MTCVAVNTAPGMLGETGDVPAGSDWIETAVLVVDQIISM
jgi:hypothetical protein